MSNDHILPSGITIVVDGGCLGNNHTQGDRTMYGSFAVFSNGKKADKIAFRSSDHPGGVYRWEADMELWNRTVSIPVSNNTAECEMMLAAISYLTQLGARTTARPQVRVLSDNKMVIGLLHGDKGKLPHIRTYGDVLRNAWIECPFSTEFQHVNGEWVKSILGH